MKRHLLNYNMKYPIKSFNTFGILYKSGLIFCWCRQECSGVLPSEETETVPCPFVKRIMYLIIQILSSQFPKSNTKIPRNFFAEVDTKARNSAVAILLISVVWSYLQFQSLCEEICHPKCKKMHSVNPWKKCLRGKLDLMQIASGESFGVCGSK